MMEGLAKETELTEKNVVKRETISFGQNRVKKQDFSYPLLPLPPET